MVVYRERTQGNEILEQHGVPHVVGPPPGDAAITVVDSTFRALRALRWPVVGEVRVLYRAGRASAQPGALSMEHWTPDGMLDGWPILLHELEPRATARNRLGVGTDDPLVCWIESMVCPGTVRPVAEAAAQTRGAALVRLDGPELMAAADLLVCAAGLNTHTEAICAGTDVHWVPCSRSPDQAERLTVPVTRAPRADQSERIARWIETGRDNALR